MLKWYNITYTKKPYSRKARQKWDKTQETFMSKTKVCKSKHIDFSLGLSILYSNSLI